MFVPGVYVPTRDSDIKKALAYDPISLLEIFEEQYVMRGERVAFIRPRTELWEAYDQEQRELVETWNRERAPRVEWEVEQDEKYWRFESTARKVNLFLELAAMAVFLLWFIVSPSWLCLLVFVPAVVLQLVRLGVYVRHRRHLTTGGLKLYGIQPMRKRLWKKTS